MSVLLLITLDSFGGEGDVFEVAKFRPGARVEIVPGSGGFAAVLDGDDGTRWQPHSRLGELTRYFEVPVDIVRLEMKVAGLKAYTLEVARDQRLSFETLLEKVPVEGSQVVRELDAPGIVAVRVVLHGTGWPSLYELRLYSSTTPQQIVERRAALRARVPFVAVVNAGHWRAKPHRRAVAQTLDELRWPWAVFREGEFDALAGRLEDFDLVLLNTLHRLPEDSAARQSVVAHLKTFLKRGGLLVAFDMESDARVRWTTGLGPSFRLHAGRGAIGELTGVPVHLDDPQTPLLSQPYRVSPYVTPPAHMMLHSEGWHVLATDGEGYSVLIEQALGKGIFVACSGQPAYMPLRQLLTNLWVKSISKRTQLAVTELQWPHVESGSNQVRMRLGNLGNEPRTVKLTLGNEGAPPAAERSVDLPPEAARSVVLPITLTQTQRSTLALTVAHKDVEYRFHSPVFEIPPRLTAQITSPRYRNAVFSTDPDQTVTVTAHVTGPAEGAVLHAALARQGAPGAQQQQRPVKQGGGTFVFDLANVEPGEYSVELSLAEPDGQVHARQGLRVARMAPGKHEVIIDRHGRTLINGKPFFPLGLYRIPEDRFAEFREAGFNTVVAAEGYSPEYMVKAQAAGLMVTPIYWGSQDKVEQYKDHPNILAWYISDEPGGRDQEHPDHTITNYHRTIELDPYHPVLLVDNGYDDHTLGCDILAPDIYPTTWSNKFQTNNGIWEIARKLRQAKMHPNTRDRALWYVPPALNPTEHTYSVATLRQTRAMAYGAICLGANGLLWYAHRSPEDPSWTLSESDMWPQVAQTAKELAGLSPVLLSVETPAAVLFEPEHPELLWRMYRHGGADYLMVVNWHSYPVTKVVRLPQGGKSVAQDVLTKARHKLTDGRLILTLDPLEIGMYRIQVEKPPAPGHRRPTP